MSEPEAVFDKVEISPAILSAGNTVTIGMALMRIHASDYMVRSLLAHLWVGLAAISGIVLVAIGMGLGFGVGSLLQTRGLWIGLGIGLGSLVAIAGLLYVGARFTAVGGVMVRMGVNTLRRQYEPAELYQQTVLRQIWRYLTAAVLFSLTILLVYGILLGIGAGVLVIAQVPWRNLMAQVTDANLQVWLVLGAVLAGVLYLGGVGLVGYYLTARLWFFDAVLAMEPQRTSVGALLRSWELTKGRAWKITTVMFSASLITFPVSMFAAVINLVIPVFSVLTGLLFFPLWQAIKAASYFDLAAIRAGLSFDLLTPPADPKQFLRRVSIQTPEGITLDFALGGPGSRVLAWVIDQCILYLLLTGLTLGGAALYAYVLLPVLTDRLEMLSVDKLNLWVTAIASLVGFCISNGYFIYCETFRRGQTPGKVLTKIRVVRDDGQPIGIREATLRSFIGWIDLGFFVIGLVLIVFNRAEKRLGDMAAGTLVIQDEIASKQQISKIPQHFGRLTEDTVAVLNANTDPSILSINQYLILRSFLGYRDQLSSNDRAQVSQRLASQLRSLLMPSSPEGLGTIPDDALIEAVYLTNRPAYYTS